MIETKTLFSITVDNKNCIRTFIDLSSIESEEEPLRIIHSLLEQYKNNVLDQIKELAVSEKDEIDDF